MISPTALRNPSKFSYVSEAVFFFITSIFPLNFKDVVLLLWECNELSATFRLRLLQSFDVLE